MGFVKSNADENKDTTRSIGICSSHGFLVNPSRMKSSRIFIRKLSSNADTSGLQAVLEAAPRYSLNLSGGTQPPNAAQEVFSALPDNFDSSNKYVFGIELESSLIGCIDLLRGFPKPETAMLGLLLLRESHQRQGFGREVYFQLEEKLREWSEIKIVRISVVKSNGEVLGFWKKLGFVDTGVRRPYQSGDISSEAVVLEKPLQ
jgi:diamine N-acetyltransferase